MAKEFRPAAARPVEEALIWAPGAGLQTVKIDESVTLNFGGAFHPYWISTPVWRDPAPGRLATLGLVVPKYVSEAASTFICDASGDGGQNWYAGNPNPVVTALHHEGVQTANVDFGYVMGHDLRVRFCFPDDEIVIIRGFLCELFVRGSVRYRVLNF